MTAGARRILLGEITGVHGVRGAVVIRSFTSDPRGIADYGPLSDETGRVTYAVAIERVTPKGGVIARLAGIADRTAAEKLRGVKLYAARHRLPKPAAGEFYHADLIGLAAVDADGAAVGEVVRVENFGAGDLLEIRLAGTKHTELLPMTEACVKEVDLEGRRIVVAMPAAVEAKDDDSDTQA